MVDAYKGEGGGGGYVCGIQNKLFFWAKEVKEKGGYKQIFRCCLVLVEEEEKKGIFFK